MKPIKSPYPRPPLPATPVHPIIRWTDQACLLCLATASLWAVAQFIIGAALISQGEKVQLGWTGVVGFILNIWFLVLCVKKKSPRERIMQERLCLAIMVFWPASLIALNNVALTGLVLFTAILGFFVWRSIKHIKRHTPPPGVPLESMINTT